MLEWREKGGAYLVVFSPDSPHVWRNALEVVPRFPIAHVAGAQDLLDLPGNLQSFTVQSASPDYRAREVGGEGVVPPHPSAEVTCEQLLELCGDVMSTKWDV